MAETARHRMPLLSAGQAQKEITHNEALTIIDRLLQVGVATRSLASPPAMPTTDLAYIVGATPGGAWAGHAGQLANHDGFGWTFTAPVRGCLAWIADERVFSVFDDDWSIGGWPAAGLAVGGRQVLAAPAVMVSGATGGTTVDVQARETIGLLLTALRDQGSFFDD